MAHSEFREIGELLQIHQNSTPQPFREPDPPAECVTIGNRSRPVLEWLRDFGVPARSRGASFLSYRATTPEQSKALQVAQAMANEICRGSRREVRSRLFCGLPGTGKTHLACSVIGMVLRAGKVSRYTTAPDIARSVRSSYSKASDTTEEIILGKLASVPLLVIDEIGLGIGSEHEKSMVLDVISKRYDEMVPTLVISNLSQKEIFAYLGERIIDRFREDLAQIVEFSWASERGKIQAARTGGDKV